jgi:predicted DNA binding CopG/RHH family protein
VRRRIASTDEPVEARIIKDFLPPPEQLVLREPTVRVSLRLSQRSVDFFKRHARKGHTPYQTMIRRVLDLYAARHGH